jgi:hypothetical protein
VFDKEILISPEFAFLVDVVAFTAAAHDLNDNIILRKIGADDVAEILRHGRGPCI